jgi:hypothetical protein
MLYVNMLKRQYYRQYYMGFIWVWVLDTYLECSEGVRLAVPVGVGVLSCIGVRVGGVYMCVCVCVYVYDVYVCVTCSWHTH